ncbi:MAG: DUF6531 domain-containing protein, partial [Candidatus Acidiferrales bacterium]
MSRESLPATLAFTATYPSPNLYLNGLFQQIKGTSATKKGAPVSITMQVTVPWYSAANQTRTQTIYADTGADGGGYIVQNGWDQVGRGMVERHRRTLNQLLASGKTASSDPEEVLGESLAMLSYTWLAECAAQQHLSDQLLGTTTQYFYGVGMVGESVGTSISGPYVDLPLNAIGAPARINGNSTVNSLTAFVDASGTGSSFESTVLEQTQAQVSNFLAASTVQLFDTAVINGDKIIDINNSAGSYSASNWSTWQSQIQANYVNTNNKANPNADYQNLLGYVQLNNRVIAPLHGNIAVGSWNGVGFKTLYGSGYGEIISGGLSGGFTGTNVGATQVSDDAVWALTPPTAFQADQGGMSLSQGSVFNGGDPISIQKGSYQYQHDDLAIGGKAFPYGLTFRRIYDSNAQGSGGPLGYGWTHNFAITASVNSDGFAGMGQASLLNAVSSIAALYVSSDLMKGQAMTGQQNLENFVLEAIVNRWFTDQLTNNVVNIAQGWNTEEFVQMADSSYSAPLGSATILDVSGGNFRYRTKTGVTMSFNGGPCVTAGCVTPPAQISTWTNAAGASVSFSYSGSGGSALLSSVTN